MRAILHNATAHGLESQNRDGRPDFAAYLKGRVEFVCMVDPRRAVMACMISRKLDTTPKPG